MLIKSLFLASLLVTMGKSEGRPVEFQQKATPDRQVVNVTSMTRNYTNEIAGQMLAASNETEILEGHRYYRRYYDKDRQDYTNERDGTVVTMVMALLVVITLAVCFLFLVAVGIDPLSLCCCLLICLHCTNRH